MKYILSFFFFFYLHLKLKTQKYLISLELFLKQTLCRTIQKPLVCLLSTVQIILYNRPNIFKYSNVFSSKCTCGKGPINIYQHWAIWYIELLQISGQLGTQNENLFFLNDKERKKHKKILICSDTYMYETTMTAG